MRYAVLDFADKQAEEQPSLLLPVCETLLSLWQKHARGPRLATPLLRTVEVLLLHTHLLQLSPTSHNILRKLYCCCMLLLLLHDDNDMSPLTDSLNGF